MSDENPPTEEAAPATAAKPRKLQLSLLENAYDSLNDSLESVVHAEHEPRGWKLAVFLLAHAIELFMKERLRREHRLLVYTNVDRPGHTVSMEIALDRLRAVGAAIDPADERVIRTAIGWRDRIAHNEAVASVQTAPRRERAVTFS